VAVALAVADVFARSTELESLQERNARSPLEGEAAQTYHALLQASAYVAAFTLSSYLLQMLDADSEPVNDTDEPDFQFDTPQDALKSVLAALDGAIALAKFLWEKLDAGTRALLSGAWAMIKEYNPFAGAFEGAKELARYIGDTLSKAFDIDLFEKGVAMIKSLKDGIWSVLTEMVASIKSKLASIVPDWMTNWGERGSQPPTAYQNNADEFSGVTGGRATGGPVRAGMIYRWLEEGQEMFSPAVDGNVISNRQLRGMRQGGGRSMSISLGGVVIHAAPGQSPMDIARAVRAEFERLISESGALHDGGEYAG